MMDSLLMLLCAASVQREPILIHGESNQSSNLLSQSNVHVSKKKKIESNDLRSDDHEESDIFFSRQRETVNLPLLSLKHRNTKLSPNPITLQAVF